MVSILFFFCNNRLPFFKKTITCLENIKLYDKCEKIVCSDEKTDFRKDGYKLLEINRPCVDYNWAKVWSIGIEAASNNIIWYLDCDRVVHHDYLIEALKIVKNNQWVYPKNTFVIKKDVDIITLQEIQNGYHKNMLTLEPRCSNPPSIIKSQPGKNPISGNTLFTKSDFIKSGGLNHDFEGYGYADLDYYMKLHQSGVHFTPMDYNEYHQCHQHAVTDERNKKMMYYNGLLYCKNWNLHPHEPLLSNSIIHGLKLEQVAGSFLAYEKRGIKLI